MLRKNVIVFIFQQKMLLWGKKICKKRLSVANPLGLRIGFYRHGYRPFLTQNFDALNQATKKLVFSSSQGTHSGG